MIILTDTGGCLHNLGVVFRTPSVLVTEHTRGEEFLSVTQSSFVGFLNILD